MDLKEVQDYIAECAANGTKNMVLICDSLRVEISDIDAQLKKMDALRIRRAKLTSILSSLDDNYRKQTAAQSQDFDETSDEAKQLQRQVVQLINAGGPLTNREIIANVGNYQEDSKVILSLKWLIEKGILAREDNSERRYYQGKHWGECDSYLNGE